VALKIRCKVRIAGQVKPKSYQKERRWWFGAIEAGGTG
jgi:hypothetical protein